MAKVDDGAATNRAYLNFFGRTLAPVADGVLVVDAAGQTVFANEAARRSPQHFPSPDNPVEQQPAEYNLRYPNGRPVPSEETPLALALRGEAVVELVLRAKGPDGRDAYLSHTAGPVRDDRGVIVGAYSLWRDVTKRERARAEHGRPPGKAQTPEERDELLAERLVEALADLGEGVLILDERGQVVLRNRADRELSGWSDEEVNAVIAGRHKATLFQPDGKRLPWLQWPIVRLLMGKPVSGQEVAVARPDGSSRSLLVSGGAARDAAGKVSLAILLSRDVTALTERERAREEYISLISHDVRQPLTVITGLSQWLRRQLAQAALAREAAVAQRIHASGQHTTAMIRDMVDSMRLESGRLPMRRKPVDLVQFLRDLVGRVGTLEDQGRLRVEGPDRLPRVPADAERLERAIANVIGNALKYAPPDTPVTIRTSVHEAEVWVSVIDHGIGIAPENQARVFERYFRVETGKETDGLGLGLYIARLIVEAHGGRIWVESAVGRGSTFTIALPDSVPGCVGGMGVDIKVGLCYLLCC